MSRWRVARRATAGLLLALAHVAAPAHAAAVRGLSDGRLLASDDPVQRAVAIRVAQDVGARVARIPIAWATVADQSLLGPAPAAVPLSDPSHPAYDWSRIDASLRDIAASGLTPLVYFATVPPWAQSAPRYRYAWVGTWAPRPAALADFAAAVARRYDGTFPDPLHAGRTLPRVRWFQTWNEPNLARYLQPQWTASNTGRPTLFSPGWYRRMHLAAYAAIHAQQPDAIVGLAGLAPTGDHTEGGARIEPLRFLRALLCLGTSRRACPEPLPFDAIAIHPLSTADPDRPAQRADDIAVADLQPKLRDLLTRALHAGRIDRATARVPLWVTELNWTSADGGGVPAAKQVAVIGRAMARLEQAGADLVGWQFATDPPVDRTFGLERPAGLTVPVAGDGRQLPGHPKHFLRGFRVPVAAIATGHGSSYVWAQLPDRGVGRSAAHGASRVTVERWVPASHGATGNGRWKRVARLAVDDRAAVARGVVGVPKGSRLRVRVRSHGFPGDEVSGEVRAVTRLGRIRVDAQPHGARSAAAQIRTTPAPADHRPVDPDGPGAFPTIPPVIAGGAPPAPNGRMLIPRPVRPVPRRAMRFAGTRGSDVLLGTSASDTFVDVDASDLVIGLGGRDVVRRRGRRAAPGR